MKLRLVKAPKLMAIAETKMRYNLELDGEVVAEVYFNMRGYVVDRKPGQLQGFITGEQSLTQLKREVAFWNRENGSKT